MLDLKEQSGESMLSAFDGFAETKVSDNRVDLSAKEFLRDSLRDSRGAPGLSGTPRDF